jgi:hypothetical protein
MGAKGKAVAIALVGAGALAAFGFQGSAKAGEAEPKPDKKKPKKSPAKVGRVTLSVKYARLFGVPPSLVLATTYAQSGNRANAQRENKRGGAWGYGQVTLATAKEIWPRFQNKIGKSWDLTGKGLLDPALNLALTAAFLSLWWKRYKANPRGWFLTACAYVLGPGRVRQVLPKDSGALPKPLPADFARIKTAFVKALATAEVKKAVQQEGKAPVLAGAEALYGKALSKTIADTTTGYQARALFGKMTTALGKAYATLKNYDPSGIAQATKIDAGSVKAAREYLDSTNVMLGKYYKQMPESNNRLTADQLNKLRVAVSTSSVAVKTVDDLFGTSWGSELFGEITTAAKQIVSKAGDVVGLDKTSMAIAVGGIIGAAVLVLAIKK